MSALTQATALFDELAALGAETPDGASFSPTAIDASAQHTIGLYSLSKAYGLASWRIGYMLVPENLVDAVIASKAETIALLLHRGEQQLRRRSLPAMVRDVLQRW